MGSAVKTKFPLASFAGFVILAVFSAACGAAEPQVTTNSADNLKLNFELRDGSRIVGSLAEPTIRIRSELLGDISLPLARIHSIEEIQANGSARLRTRNGDDLPVRIQAEELQVETIFGKLRLPISLIRRLGFMSLEAPTPESPGPIAFWLGNNNEEDSVGSNHGRAIGRLAYVPGHRGTAFYFNGTDAAVKVAAHPKLDVGKGDGLTIACWISPANLSIRSPLVEWNRGGPDLVEWGVHLYILRPEEFGLGAGNLFGNIWGTDGTGRNIMAPGGTIVANKFQHVALTYDKQTGLASLYRDGVAVASLYFGAFTPQTSYDLYFGSRPAGDGVVRYRGLLDEVQIYNRALTAEEIRRIVMGEGVGPGPAPAPPSRRE